MVLSLYKWYNDYVDTYTVHMLFLWYMYLYEVNQSAKYNIHITMYVIDSNTTSTSHQNKHCQATQLLLTLLHTGTYIAKQSLVAQYKSIIGITRKLVKILIERTPNEFQNYLQLFKTL